MSSWIDRTRNTGPRIRSSADGKATSYQRLAIRCELRSQDYPTDHVTVMHRDLFAAANVPFNQGNALDAELCALTRQQASRLLSQLKGTS